MLPRILPRPLPPVAPGSFLTIAAASLALVASACGAGTGVREGEEEVVEWVPPEEPPAGSPVARHGHLRLEGTQIVDEQGDPVQLRGVSTQWLSYEGTFSSSATAITWMRDHWDIELVRGAMGVEEEHQGYLVNPDGMLFKLETVIQNAIDAGVYVIVDWHDHAAHLHQAQAEQFFTMMARKWGGYPHVIWETFNEPVGDVDWSGVLKPYHEAVVARIRAEDEDNLIVLGNPVWSQQPHVAIGAEVEGTNLLYTMHFYSCTHGTDVIANGQAALDAGLPVFVTEWGATTADGGVLANGGRVCEPEAQQWFDWINQNSISWAAWRLDACTDLTCLFKPGVSAGGDWTEDDLNGHGPFVVEKLLE